MITDHVTLFDMIIGAIYQAEGDVNLAAEKVCYSLSSVTQNEFIKFKRVWKRNLREEAKTKLDLIKDTKKPLKKCMK